MNSRELVRRALDRGDTPRPAVGPLAVHFCARTAGVSLREYTLSAERLAACVVRYHERYRPDAVWVSADTWVSGEAMGARVAFPGEGQPLGGAGTPLVRTASDLARIPAPDPSRQGRWPLMLDALRRIRRALGPEVFIVGCFDQYPFSLACALMGVQDATVAALDDRPLLEALMGRCADAAVAYASALAEAGADMLSGGDSPAGLLGPDLYRDVALPFERRVVSAVKARARVPVSLHICGDATPILAHMAASGADVLELDHLTDLQAACRTVPGDVAIWGNLDPVGVLSRGSPADVARAAAAVLATMSAAGRRRFVLSSGCTLAVETPEANLRALIDFARSGPVQAPSAGTEEKP